MENENIKHLSQRQSKTKVVSSAKMKPKTEVAVARKCLLDLKRLNLARSGEQPLIEKITF